jgi:hypothetical protein
VDDDDDTPTFDGGTAEDWERRTRVHSPRAPQLEYPEDHDETGMTFTVTRSDYYARRCAA